MKKVVLLLALLLNSLTFQSQIVTPQPSPKCILNQMVGLTDVEIEYSRPGVKGRNVFGNLVPFGKVWRTGANSNSTISFSDILFPPKSWIQVASGLNLLNANEFIHNIEQYSRDDIAMITNALLINQKNVSTTCMSHKDFLNFCTQ